MTLTKMLRCLGLADRATVHGFRTSFKRGRWKTQIPRGQWARRRSRILSGTLPSKPTPGQIYLINVGTFMDSWGDYLTRQTKPVKNMG